ncbi:MAG TPA: PorV/PorQ family protein [Gemmatimonadaceae bacterium]|nr:PorV/PorQ family protein [Gemmatimonadaceae bacterium]
MRRVLSSLALAALATGTARAQGSEGALFLLLPTGAQSVGMGQAMVAGNPGSEGIWWNPSSIAAQEKRELAIHHSETIVGVGDAITFVLPSRNRGTAAISINILNLGEQQLTDELGNPIGFILPRDIVLAATYAGRYGRRFSSGLTYKLVQLRIICSGQCTNVGTLTESTTAADLGVQYEIEAGSPLTFGLAVRNLGGKLNTDGTNRATPLPTQVELGALYRLRFLDRYVKDVEVLAAGSLVDSRSNGGKAVRLGTDAIYQKKVHLRAGFVGRDSRADASASLGFGLKSGPFVFDIARVFGGIPGEDGEQPFYISLRYLF